ncbi:MULTISPECIES: ribokinase [Bacillus subtilis group]|uniref:ribokinase n=1 Tax=Bacillus subtilis group TaxID=653685 RepID=UPI001646A966|nr:MULTISPECIES: ribokinase [Bacillus subtilis group]MCF7616360.1 ribokinase [Bacillus sonorensis]MCY8089315.1 ribokinase [Bacillus sonorensis]MCY8562029.1 ribokinase [Bacillus sonorensis]MCZ0068501.1 ribokinase [Bacillus sonorensis]MCZ0094896.1 ribokinase [Bacillus sonorensis]
MSNICVIGSSSMDLVVTSQKRPKAGETVLGDSFKTVPGGKGANQAVAAARLGAEVHMIGCVGDDHYGKAILANLKANDVLTDYVEPVTDTESGTAHIVLADGDNSIIVVKGANDHVTPEYVERALPAIERADIVMIQQEIPEDTVDYVSRLCKTIGTPLLLNPAPARPLSKATIENAAYITPNEHEASVLFQGLSREEALQRFPEKLFITEGKNGVRFHNGTEERLIPSFPVKAVDTTGAGDTFNAGLAVALSEGGDIESALRFANRAASLSVLKFGAQGGMPKRAEVERALS